MDAVGFATLVKAALPVITALGPFASIALMMLFAWLYTNSTKRDTKAHHEKLEGIGKTLEAQIGSVSEQLKDVKKQVDCIEKDMAATYVRKDVHSRDIELLAYKIEENRKLNNGIFSSLESQGFNGGRGMKDGI